MDIDSIRKAVGKRPVSRRTAESRKKRAEPSRKGVGAEAVRPTSPAPPTSPTPSAPGLQTPPGIRAGTEGVVSALPARSSPSFPRPSSIRGGRSPARGGRTLFGADPSSVAAGSSGGPSAPGSSTGPSAPPSEEEILLSMKVRRDASVFRDSSLARDLLSLITLPADWDVSKSRPLETIVSSARSSLFQVVAGTYICSFFLSNVYSLLLIHAQLVHDVGILEEGMSGFGLLSRSLRDEAQSAAMRAEVSEELLRAGEERERKLKEDLARLNGEIVSLVRERDLAWKDAADGRQAARIERERATQAEVRASRVEERVSQAIADYKASPAFKDDVAEGCVESYQYGFDDCRDAVLARFPSLDLSGVEPPAAPDAPSPGDDAHVGDAPADV